MLTLIIQKIIPLYLIIGLGFIAGRFLKVSKKSVADLVIYIISPVVFFGYVAQVKFSWARVSLPLITFIVPLTLALIGLQVGKFIFQDNRRNLAAVSAASGNTGYFGVPVFIAFFNSENLGLYTLAVVGYMFFESGPGYFILARGKHGIHESLQRMLSLPALYAATLGIIWSVSGTELSTGAKEIITQFRGCYVVLGMMLIGVALSDIKKMKLDRYFLSYALLGKFVAMPVLTFVAILIITKAFHIDDLAMIQVLATFSCVPLAANLTAYAAQLNLHTETAATTVLISTVVALFLMPFIIPLLVTM